MKHLKQIIFLITLFIGLSSLVYKKHYHPIYIAVVEMEYNNSNNYATLVCKTFIDDLQKGLQKQFSDNEISVLSGDVNKISKDIDIYIKQHLQVKLNDKPAVYSFINFVKKDNAIVSTFRINNINHVSKVDLDDTILYEIYSDQIEITYITVNGNRKNAKVRNPDSKMSFNF